MLFHIGVCELDFFSIEGRQSSTKCMHITSFKFVQTAPEHRDAMFLPGQSEVNFNLCGCFENYMVSFSLIYAGLVTSKAL